MPYALCPMPYPLCQLSTSCYARKAIQSHIRQSEGVGNWGDKIRVSPVSFLLIQIYG